MYRTYCNLGQSAHVSFFCTVLCELFPRSIKSGAPSPFEEKKLEYLSHPLTTHFADFPPTTDTFYSRMRRTLRTKRVSESRVI